MIGKIEVNFHKRSIHKKKPFVLIGNEIDGRLFCDTLMEFKNFTELKEKLPKVIKKIKGEGEWAFELYQVDKSCKIWHRWGYYKYPNRGKKIFRYDYCDAPIETVEFDDNEMLIFGVNQDSRGIRTQGISFTVSKINLIWTT